MKRVYSRVGQDFHDTYLCKCGMAWEVTRGSRRTVPGDDFSPLKYFTKYEVVDAEKVKNFMGAVARDVATL
jgi:hypothetical protein